MPPSGDYASNGETTVKKSEWLKPEIYYCLRMDAICLLLTKNASINLLTIRNFQMPELVPYYLIAEQVMKVNQSYADGSDLQNKLLELLRFRDFPEATDLPIAVNLSATI